MAIASKIKLHLDQYLRGCMYFTYCIYTSLVFSFYNFFSSLIPAFTWHFLCAAPEPPVEPRRQNWISLPLSEIPGRHNPLTLTLNFVFLLMTYWYNDIGQNHIEQYDFLDFLHPRLTFQSIAFNLISNWNEWYWNSNIVFKYE